MTDGQPPAISVIVPSYNSARTMRRCLESLLAQDTAIDYEVIVVDSSTDDTPAVVSAFAPRVKLVRSDTQLFPGPARNLGIGHARAPVIAFTDADCVVQPDWIEGIRRAHESHDAVGGRILNGTPGNACGTALYLAEFVEFAGTRERRFGSVPSCNISYKRGVFERHGVFPDVAWGEEYILNTRIPGGIFFAPAVVVRHVNRTGFAETVRHARKVGRGAAISRRATGQVGWLFRFRFLVPLLFFFRFLKIGRSAFASGQALAFLAASPVLAVDLAAWTLGFFEGAREEAHPTVGGTSVPIPDRGSRPSHASPQVSVVMPAYNAAATIARSIASVLAQTCGDFELLVIDDGSTDGTAAIVGAVADPRVRLLTFENRGPSASRNRGVAPARGEFVAFLDADDLWTRDKLERQRDALLANPRAALAYSWTDCIDTRDRFLQHGSHVRVEDDPYAMLVTRNFLDNGSSPMVRRSALLEAGPFDETLRNAEDWDLWLRIAHRHAFACVPAVQVLYRVSAASNAANIDRQVSGTLTVLDRALARLPPSAERERQRRISTANLYKFIAVRLVETAETRAAGRAAGRYWWRFVRATPTPVAHLGKALVILAAVLAILVLPPRLLAALRGRVAEVRGRRWQPLMAGTLQPGANRHG